MKQTKRSSHVIGAGFYTRFGANREDLGFSPDLPGRTLSGIYFSTQRAEASIRFNPECKFRKLSVREPSTCKSYLASCKEALPNPRKQENLGAVHADPMIAVNNVTIGASLLREPRQESERIMALKAIALLLLLDLSLKINQTNAVFMRRVLPQLLWSFLRPWSLALVGSFDQFAQFFQ